MNKKLFFPLVAALFTLSFIACGDTVVEDLEKFPTQNQPIETAAKLTIVVKDGLTGEVVKDAEVTLVSDGTKGTPISEGTFAFENMRVGAHSLRISAEGYADVVEDAYIGAQEAENVLIAHNNSVTKTIYPLASGLEGTILYTNKDGRSLPAEGVSIEVHFTGSSNIEQKIYPSAAKTGKDGKFTFAKGTLPTGYSYSIVATADPTKVEGIVFQPVTFTQCDRGASSTPTLTNVPSLARGVVVNAGFCTIAQTANTDVFAVLEYNELIPVTNRATPVTFKFTSKVDATLLTQSTISIAGEAFEYAWNATYDAVTITPVNKWDGGTTNGVFYVNFTGDFKSATGKSFTGVPTGGFPVLVNKVNLAAADKEVVATRLMVTTTNKDSIAHNTASVFITWPTVEGAESYTICSRADNLSNFTCPATPTVNAAALANKDTLIRSVTFPTFTFEGSTTSQIQNRTIEYLVQASNTQSKSILNAASAVKLFDNSNPTYISSASNSGFLVGNDSVVTTINGTGNVTYTSAGYYKGTTVSLNTLLGHTRPEAATVSLGCYNWVTENMDISIKPAVAIKNELTGLTVNPNGGGAVSVNSPMAARITSIDAEWETGSEKNLCFTATIAAYDATTMSTTTTDGKGSQDGITEVRILVSVSGLKDKSPIVTTPAAADGSTPAVTGNKYFLTYKDLLNSAWVSVANGGTATTSPGSTRTKTTETLDFRISASVAPVPAP